MLRFGIVIALACVACGGPRPLPRGVRRVELATGVDGLSGLTIDPEGRLWAIAESGVLVRIEGTRGVRVALEGVPEGLDTESIAWLEGDRVAIGTESMDTTRDGDDVLIARVDGDRARVIDRVRLPYSVLGVSAEENHGIEGLCVAGGRLFAALENVRAEGDRLAPIAIYDLEEREWAARWVRLGSETGKISGLACRAQGDAAQAFAIERHFGVARVIRFELSSDARDTITPEIVRNLDGALEGDPNPEGIELEPGGVVLVIDNHYARRTGPSELIHVRL